HTVCIKKYGNPFTVLLNKKIASHFLLARILKTLDIDEWELIPPSQMPKNDVISICA
ncbi:hypothetical protein MKX01_038060, partial [Papaver californicum]